MLKLIYPTAAAKLGPIATTYRTGPTNRWGSCPNTCPLKPTECHGADHIDTEYLDLVRRSVPRQGYAWTYSHFNFRALPKPIPGETTINPSCDSKFQAIEALEHGYTPVLAVPHNETEWPAAIQGNLFIRCPAETNKNTTCSNCGSGQPLCARPERDYVIVFTAHGSMKKLIGSNQLGGCYGTVGPTALQWSKAAQSYDSDLHYWATQILPPRTLLRHHIVGDFGNYKTAAPALAA